MQLVCYVLSLITKKTPEVRKIQKDPEVRRKIKD